MSQTSLYDIRRIRDQLLAEQRECSWCKQNFNSAGGLADHIAMSHLSEEKRKSYMRLKENSIHYK